MRVQTRISSRLALFSLLLPSLATAAVGVTRGDADVTRNGNATYDVELTLPPDRLTPSIAISYSHARGNGLLGMGFALSGFSLIQRCGLTIAQDGVTAPVLGQDRFGEGYCLDGKRLRQTAGPMYAAPGSEYDTEEASLARITAHGDGVVILSWTVETRDGLIHEYGATTDSRVYPVGDDVPRLWALNRTRDRAGNYIDFVYIKDSSDGSYRPSEIRYAGNQPPNQPQQVAPSTRIVFVYETAQRPDPIYQYRQGSGQPGSGIIVEDRRLDRIDIFHEGTPQAIRKYELTYEANGGAGGRSRLSSLQECVAADCFAATNFQWINGQLSWAAEASTGSANTGGTSVLVLDFDNDGQDDILYPSSTTSGGTWMVMRGSNTGYLAPLNTTASSTNHAAAQVIEWNGDGAGDLLVPCSSGTTWCVFYQRTGSAPNQVFNQTPLDTGIAISQLGTTSPLEWLALDFTGDGRSDLVRLAKPPGGDSYVAARIRDGGGFLAETVEVPHGFNQQFTSDFGNLIAARRSSANRKMDFDGDGAEDFFVYFQGGGTTGATIVCGSDRNGLAGVDDVVGVCSIFNFGFTSAAAMIWPGDFNGDGLTDVAYPIPGVSWRIHYGNGSGLTFDFVAGPTLASSTVQLAMVADVDADGMSDLLMKPTAGANWLWSRSFGAAFGPLIDTGISAASTAVPIVSDANGDGLQDLTRADSAAGNGWKLRLHAGVVPDVLDRATDGFGNFADFDYRSTGIDDPFYLRDSSLAYPLRSYHGPMLVVWRHTANDGIGGNYFIQYQYSRGVLDPRGRGFQSFSGRNFFDSREQRHVFQTLQIGFPGTGTVFHERSAANGVELYDNTFNYSSHVFFPSGSQQRYVRYLANSIQLRKGETGSVVTRTTTTNTVDIWGSVTDSVATVEEVSTGLNPGATHVSRTWHPQVTNDESNWCLGKPTQTRLIRSHSLAGGAQMTRSIDHSWDTASCRLTGEVAEPGDTNWQVTTAYEYDDFGNVDKVTVTPASGHNQIARSTTIDWGATGRFPQSFVDPMLNTTTLAWDVVRGLRTGMTDANGLTGSMQYDVFGRLTRIVNLDGTATELNWDSCTTPACQGSNTNIRLYVQEIARNTANEEITQTRHYFDSYEREVLRQGEQRDGTFASIRQEYDARGLLQRTSTPFAAAGVPFYTSFTYDSRGRPTLIRRPTSDGDATNHDTQFSYDGLRTVATDTLGRTTTTYFSAVGDSLQVTDAAGQDTEYEYDAFSNLLKMRDPLGAETSFTYNARGLRMSSSDPDSGPWFYNYYPLGELKSTTDAKNQTIAFTYDKLSRPLTRTMPEGAGSITSTFTWGTSSTATNIGRLEWMQIAGTGLTTYRETYTYDSKGRPVQLKYTEGTTDYFVDYAYNTSSGLLETVTYPTSTAGFRMPILYEYQNGWPSRVSSNGTQWWVATEEDASGNVTKATIGDALSGVTLDVSSTYDDVTNLPKSHYAEYSSGAVDGTVIANLAFVYDRAGNVIQRQENQQALTEDFYYDNLDRLDHSTLGAATTQYGYDARGNLTSKTGVGTLYSYTATVAGCTYYPHAQVHAVRRVTGGSATLNFCYDANGNMTNRNGTSLTWFANNLPKVITKDVSNSSTFQYTPIGQRWRHVYRSAGADYTHTYFGRLMEKVVGPTTTDYKHYVYVNEQPIGVYIRRSNGAKSTHYFVKDNLGGISAMNQSGAQWTMRESFDAFGQRRGPSWTGSPSSADLTRMRDTTRRGFTFHEHLDSTNLVHMNGRVYDPAIGRFASADPIVQAPYFSQSLNRYSYLFNNPLSGSDPSGFMGPGCTSGDGGDACGGGLGSNMFNFNFIVNGWFYVNSFPFNPLGNLIDFHFSINLADLDLSGICTGPSGENLCVVNMPPIDLPNPPGDGVPPGGPPDGDQPDRDPPDEDVPPPSDDTPIFVRDAGWASTVPNPFTRFREPGSAAAIAGYEFYRDPDISPQTKETVAVTGFGVMLTMSVIGMVPELVGLGTAGAGGAQLLALQGPRQVAAHWSAGWYKHGGFMTGVEHIFYRHGFKSAWTDASKFAQGMRLRDLAALVDRALRYGKVTRLRGNGYQIDYNFMRAIGTDLAGNPTNTIRVIVRDGIIRTAYPL